MDLPGCPDTGSRCRTIDYDPRCSNAVSPPADLATALQVDPKSVERWIKGRTPYRRHRYAVAAHLGVDETYLWPDALSSDQIATAAESEIINVYAHRWAVPSDLWRDFFDNAEQHISVLVYSGLFLSEDAGIRNVFQKKAEAGATVRILLGDPDSDAVAQRGADEGINDSMAGKVRNALVMYQPLRGVDGIDFRLHDTTLYNSIYRGDDELLVNAHTYAVPASHAPVLHLQRTRSDGMTAAYLDSFERVWSTTRPA